MLAQTSNSSQQTSSASTQPQPVTIEYDASSQTYLVSRSGSSASFGPGDRSDGGGATGVAQYATGSGADQQSLTIVAQPPGRSEPNQYVALGLWRHPGSGDSEQFDFFTFGFPTPAGAMPLTGMLTYQTDVSGIVTYIGARAASLSGQGEFSVDLASGQFVTSASLSESDLWTDAEIASALLLSGSGSLGSDRTGFSGSFAYHGNAGTILGTLTGGFYGPAGEEIGATFGGSSALGGTITGAFTGKR